MITKIFQIITKTGKAEKDIKDLSGEVETLNTGIETTNEEVSGLKKSGKSLQGLKKGAKGVAGGFRMMGTALKAAGIGLVLAAFAGLKTLFEQNQKVVDTFNIAFETLSLAFSDFFKYIGDNVEAVSGFFKKIFDDPLESLKTFSTAIKNNLIERVKSAIIAFGFLSIAMKKLFARDFDGALKAVKEAGKELVDVVTGVDNSTEKIAKTVKEGIKVLTEYSTTTLETAKANVELRKQASLAAVANQGLIEKYDRQAEQQRQIRDDERKSIEDRKKANDELAIILDKQEKTMLSNAKISLRASQIDLKKDKNNIDFKKAVMEAENELAAVRATVAGFRSEQLTNEAALQKESLELINSKLESEANLSIEQKRFNAEQIKNELERLQKQKEIDKEEKDLQLKRLQGIIDAANTGTQAKVDAEIAYNETKQELDQQDVLRAKEIADAKVRINKEQIEKKDADDEVQKQKDIAREQYIADTKESIQFNTLSAISSLIEVFANQNEKNAEKAFQLQKGLAIVETLINTSKAIMKVAAETTDVTPIQALRTANMISIGIAGAAQVAAIASRKFNASGGAGGSNPTPSASGGGTSQSQAPSFNVVGQSQANQVSMALANQPPAQAFVVAGAVTNAQQLQNNTIQTATF